MKKALAFSFAFLLFAIAASAQNEKTENYRRHLLEERMHNREFRHPGMNTRPELYRHRMIRQEMIRHKAFRAKREARMRMMEQRHHRKMLMRRYYFRHRVI